MKKENIKMNYNKILLSLSLIILHEIKSISNQNQIQENFYTKLKEFNNYQFDNSSFLKTFYSKSILKCFKSCTQSYECVYIIYDENKCIICKMGVNLFMSYDGDSLIYRKKFNLTTGLINYWTFNRNVNDLIGNAHLYGGVNAALTFDRFGLQNSALSLTDGYYRAPSGIYFSGTQFSILAWVKVKIPKSWARLIDFGVTSTIDGVWVSFSSSNTGKPYFITQNGNLIQTDSLTALNLTKWQHLACVFSYPDYLIYIDGKQVVSKKISTSFFIKNVTRNSNFIGKSNSANNDPNANADIDDLKIFNRALSQSEILFEINNNL